MIGKISVGCVCVCNMEIYGLLSGAGDLGTRLAFSVDKSRLPEYSTISGALFTTALPVQAPKTKWNDVIPACGDDLHES